MSLPRFDEKEIQALATDEVYYRGKDYYASGAVRRLAIEGDAYRAQVLGTHRYTVRIWEEEGEVQTSCTCPYEWGGACKHVVAAMLAILRQEEDGRNIEPLLPAPTEPAVPLDEILGSLAVEPLRAFVRLQAAEYPQVAENLQIFAQGTAPTDKKVEKYEAEVAAVLKEGEFTDPEEGDDYEHYDEFEEGDAGDTIEGLLQPFRDLARRYQAQGNWIENAKIQEAIVHACGKIAMEGDEEFDEDEEDEEEGGDEEDESDEEEEYDDEEEFYEEDHESDDHGDGYLEEGCVLEARKALVGWAEALAGAVPEQHKLQHLERFLALFAADTYAFLSPEWEKVFKIAVRSTVEAKSALSYLKAQRVKDLDQDAEKAGGLLHLLDLSGEVERFVKVGQKAVQKHPRLALPLGEKLVAMKRRAEAIQVAEKALAKTRDSRDRFDPSQTRESLLRFLCRTYDPSKEYKRLVECSQTLLFEENKLADYTILRDLLRTPEEREELIQKVKANCAPAALIEIFSAEERWKDLLDSTRRHLEAAEFPIMIQVLQARFPDECYKLYSKVLWKTVDSGTGRHLYREAAAQARQMQKIPGHEEEFAKLMGEVVDKYSRRSGLMQALGELADLGRSWRERSRTERLEKVSAKQMKGMGLDELATLCPIGEEDRVKLHGKHIAWQRSNAALVWAILTLHGGEMEAADITQIIAGHRKTQPQNAAAKRSGGLRVLEGLGYVEIEREGNQLRQVRLVKVKK